MSRYYGIALLTLTLLFGAPAWGETPAAADGKGRKTETRVTADRKADAPGARRNPLQLEAVNITGSPEHPAILFFLPRAKFRLLPFRSGQNWKERILTETKEMGDAPR